MNFDFEIWVEKWDGVKDKRPEHEELLNDLRKKQKENPENFKILLEAISLVYKYSDPEDILLRDRFKNLKFKEGLSVELLLKVLKWMFLLEDIYYWNYSRRKKLMDAIREAIQPRLL